MTYIRILL